MNIWPRIFRRSGRDGLRPSVGPEMTRRALLAKRGLAIEATDDRMPFELVLAFHALRPARLLVGGYG